MKFYTNKNIFKFILLIGAASLVAFASRQALGAIQESRDAESFDVDQYLKKEQESIIAELEACGFSQEFIAEKSIPLLEAYNDHDPCEGYQSDKPISDETKTLIHKVCKTFGIDSSLLKLQSISAKHSPAAASDYALYINDTLLTTFSPNAQAFIIGHELQHFIFKDDSYCFIMEALLTESKNQTHAELFDRISRFIEMRADLIAAKTSYEYALGQKEACLQFLTMHGDKMGNSHPANSVRIAMAERLLRSFTSHQALGTTSTNAVERSGAFNIDSYIAEEKQKIADLLREHGFTHEMITRKQTEIMPEYLDQLESMNAYILTTPLSPEITALIKEVCNDFGIDYTKLTIINIDPKSGIAEAGTTDISLVINEPLFKKLSISAQRFVLAHELQHYIYKDDSYFFAVSRLIQDSGKKELMPLLDKACYQFEMRADLLAAKKSHEYAQGQKEFCQYVLNAFGDGPGTTHPTTSLRIAMADQILTAVA